MKALTGLLCAVCTIAAHAAAPSYDAYKSWLVACDNGLACEAKGFTDGNAGSPDLRFDRAAGPEATAEAALSIPTAGPSFDPGDLRVDGRPLKLDPSAWHTDQDDGITTLSTDQPAAIASLVSQLRNGAKLQVGKSDSAFVPLNGLVAALLRMDERQGRVGGATALVRKGAEPASKAPSPLPLPVVPHWGSASTLADGEQRSLITRTRTAEAALFKKEECDASTTDASEATAYRLDTRNALVLIPCGMGAYQAWSLAFVTPLANTNANAPMPVELPLPFGRNDASDISLTEPDFDPKTGMLTQTAKGRGLADCGLQAAWIWDGRQFRLSNATYQAACGGSQPGDWPTLYRSKDK